MAEVTAARLLGALAQEFTRHYLAAARSGKVLINAGARWPAQLFDGLAQDNKILARFHKRSALQHPT
jgi:hypothetical protein